MMSGGFFSTEALCPATCSPATANAQMREKLEQKYAAAQKFFMHLKSSFRQNRLFSASKFSPSNV